ncbi:hypothetical protein J5474_20020 [Sagittula sp. M10.9X]|uniref:Uncharacterized protein n=2 Tax=Sagittula salina TaxID=2820268 RepID=A0A940MVL4_9RHOB|nr:hypothetical protein [Sagittula salina]MBP0484767.1 hypothetical protein [Sagittula salina]
MPFVSAILLTIALTLPAGAADSATADRAGYLALARTGWIYELRAAMTRRDLSIPVHINGRDFAGSALCIVGERPDPQTLATLRGFSALARQVFGRPLPMRYAGPEAQLCGPRRTVVLRLYSGWPPNRALSADLDWLNATYDLGLPRGRDYAATSPGQAQTFFGRRGAATHILVQQGGEGTANDPLARSYFRSILLEEMFQSFTFGMDVLAFHRSPRFLSKLQEVPLNIHRLPWGSAAFMRALLRSNPQRLCAFDVFMMYAVAQAPVDQTTDPAFLDWIETRFDRLDAQARDTLADPRFSEVLDPECRAWSE